MDFYMGWTHSDAIFTDYFNDCPIIVSAIRKNIRPFKRFIHYPSKLIVDSGALYYQKHRNLFHLKDIFNKQINIIQDIPDTILIKLVHVDQPMFKASKLSDKYNVMEKTLLNAYEYIQLFNRLSPSDNIKPLGVIQGFDKASIRYAIYELKKMGYEFFGVGSLIGQDPKKQIQSIKEVIRLVDPKTLHVFGVTGIPQIEKMIELGVSSFDSTRPTKAAIYFSVFYSNPFRIYNLANSNVKDRGSLINEPLPCDCPVCQNNPDDILVPSPRKFMKLRSIHNYYHLVKTIISFQFQYRRRNKDVSNLLRSRNSIGL